MKGFKKTGLILLLLVFAAALLAGCGGGKEAAAAFTDGEYFVEMPEFDDHGWKDNVTVTVTEGKITAVVLNSTNQDPAMSDKQTGATNGQYDMKSGGSKLGWDEEAKLIGDYVIEHQGTNDVAFNEEGKSDAVSGATISYSHYFDLINQALDQAKAK